MSQTGSVTEWARWLAPGRVPTCLAEAAYMRWVTSDTIRQQVASQSALKSSSFPTSSLRKLCLDVGTRALYIGSHLCVEHGRVEMRGA